MLATARPSCYIITASNDGSTIQQRLCCLSSDESLRERRVNYVSLVEHLGRQIHAFSPSVVSAVRRSVHRQIHRRPSVIHLHSLVGQSIRPCPVELDQCPVSSVCDVVHGTVHSRMERDILDR